MEDTQELFTLQKERQILVEEFSQYSGHDERHRKIVERINQIDLLMLPIEQRTSLELQKALIDKNDKKLNDLINRLDRAASKINPEVKHWWQEEMIFKWVELIVVRTFLPTVFMVIWASLETDGMIRMKISNLISRLFKIQS